MSEKSSNNSTGIDAIGEVPPHIAQHAAASAAAPVLPLPASVAPPAPQPANGLDIAAIVAQVRAELKAEGNPEIEALKRQLAEAEAANEELRRVHAAKQMTDLHNRPGTANESRASSKERWAIVIDEARDENEINPVFVQVNGRAYHIKRGQLVEVPREVVGALTDAVEVKTSAVKDGNGNPTGAVVTRQARRFPFQNHGKVIDKDGKRLKTVDLAGADHSLD